MLIKILFYVDGLQECVCSTPDAAHTICYALDNSLEVRQWRLDTGLGCFPWYTSESRFWKKLRSNWKDWDYS